jgi:lipoprotein-releasing system permease protein
VRAVQVWGIELPQRAAVSPIQEFLLRQKSVPAEPSFAMDTVTADEGGFVGIGVAASPDEMTDEYDLEKIRSETIGSRVLLTTGAARQAKPGESASGSQPDQTPYVRKAIRFHLDVVYTGMYDLDQNFIYLLIATFHRSILIIRRYDRIQVRLKPDVAPEVGIAAVREVWLRWAGKQGFLWADLAKIDSAKALQAQLIAEYHKQMQMLMMIFGLVSAGVILLVFCIFYLIVMTKQKDVAILKSCGLGSSAVGGLYIFFGLAIGAVGSGLGIALGYLITRNINAIERWISVAFGLKLWKSSTYMFSRIPSQMDWDSVAWITLAAILAAGIGSLIPAAAAARVRPVRLLRYE